MKKIVGALLIIMVITVAAGCNYTGNGNYGYTAGPNTTNKYNNAIAPNNVTPGNGIPYYGIGSGYGGSQTGFGANTPGRQGVR